MLLTCIDPRFQEPVSKYAAGRQLTGKYSQFTIAGASVGVVAPAFETWHGTFWTTSAPPIELHRINQVIAINHRDCGAAGIAYSAAAIADRATERQTHREAMAAFRRQLAERRPKMGAETWLMALDGTVEDLS
jgi:carbonic anhydrase